MATERTTGIAGNQSSQRVSATKSREVAKGRLKMVTVWFASILVVLAILTWWKNLPEDKDTDTNNTATSPSQSQQYYPQAPGMVVHPGKATGEDTAAEVRVGVTYKMLVSSAERTVLIGRTGFCLRYWGKNPDGTAFTTEARGVNNETWYPHKEYLRLQRLGKIADDPGFFGFTATSDDAEVFYEYRMRDQCN